MDRGAWWATVYGVTKSRIQFSDWACKEEIPKSWLTISLSPSREDTARRQSLASQKGRPHQETKLASTFILDSPASRTVRTELLLKAPSLWYFCCSILSSLISEQVIHSLVIASAPFSASFGWPGPGYCSWFINAFKHLCICMNIYPLSYSRKDFSIYSDCNKKSGKASRNVII